MKKKFLLSIIIIITLIIPINVYANNVITTNYENKVSLKYRKDEQKVLDNVPDIGCKVAYIAEPITGKIIYKKNSHEKMYPASTTKILTTLVVMEKEKILEDSRKDNKNKDFAEMENTNNAVKFAAFGIVIISSVYFVMEILVKGKTNYGWYSIIALYNSIFYGYTALKTKRNYIFLMV